MKSHSHKELVGKLNKHKIEVSKLRNSLNELDKEKESWFSKKGEFSKKIRELIQKIKESKSKRDSLTSEVKELKEKRYSINKEITRKSGELSRLRKEKTELAESLGIKEAPSKIRQRIKKLEFRIETQPMPFEKEQSAMRKIREMRKLYKDSAVIVELNDKTKNISEEIRKSRKEASGAHRLVQEKAKQSQIMHEEILRISNEIDKIKVQEGDAFKKFSEYKKQFTEANSQLKEQLRAINDIRRQLDNISQKRREARRQREESILKSKEEEINEKIKKGEKLTTEDFLVFQNLESNDKLVKS